MKNTLYSFFIVLLVTGSALANSPVCKHSASDNYFYQKFSSNSNLFGASRPLKRFDKWFQEITLAGFGHGQEKWSKAKAWLSGNGHLSLSYKKFPPEESIEFPKKKFRNYFVNYKGKMRNLKTELDEYFQLVLPEKLARMVIQINELHESQSRLTAFLKALRSEVIREIKNDGYSQPEIFIGSSLLNRYYDKVLAKILEEKGFVTNNGMPFDLKSFDENIFFKTLEEKKVFVDWVGLFLDGSPERLAHGARPHLLMLAYLASELPNFSDLIHYIGKTKDEAKVWRLLFDNFDYGSQLSWNGNLERYFGQYLGVSNF